MFVYVISKKEEHQDYPRTDAPHTLSTTYPSEISKTDELRAFLLCETAEQFGRTQDVELQRDMREALTLMEKSDAELRRMDLNRAQLDEKISSYFNVSAKAGSSLFLLGQAEYGQWDVNNGFSIRGIFTTLEAANEAKSLAGVHEHPAEYKQLRGSTEYKLGGLGVPSPIARHEVSSPGDQNEFLRKIGLD